MSFIYACRSYGHDKNTCHTVKMNLLDLSRLHFNKIYIPVKKKFDLHIIIHSPDTSNSRYKSVPQKWTDRTYSTNDQMEISEECIIINIVLCIGFPY